MSQSKQKLSLDEKVNRVRNLLGKNKRTFTEDDPQASSSSIDTLKDLRTPQKRQQTKLDDADADLIEKLKRAEAKYTFSKVEKAKKEIDNAYKHSFTQGEVEEIVTNGTESTRTGCLFLLLILTMVINLFAIVSVIFVTIIVWFAQDEIDLLHDMESIDSQIFFLTFGDPFVTVQAILQIYLAYSIVTNLKLRPEHETWQYMTPLKSENRLVKMRVLFVVQSCILWLSYKLINRGVTYGHNVICAVCCLLQIIAILAHGESRIKDVKEAYKEQVMLKHGKTLKKLKFPQIGLRKPNGNLDSLRAKIQSFKQE